MPIEGFIVLAFLPSPEFLLLTIAWDWVLHYSFNTKYLLVAGESTKLCPWLVLGREAKGYLTLCY